ncbi:MAG: glycogen/starch synthase [Treponema sp.]|nr:glycogen/starch synthase [Candidatus Treponema caballi]
MSIWEISREYAGIAEAGGVKNVVCSLSEGLYQHGFEVTVFLPFYGCTVFSSIEDFEIIEDVSVPIAIDGRDYQVSYATGSVDGIQFVFIVSHIFTDKLGVYTYTELDEKKDSSRKHGEGHADAPVMEMLFQKAVLEYGVSFPSAVPEIIHCHDATCAFLPSFARELPQFAPVYEKTRFMTTIHNAGPYYHHEIPSLERAEALTGLSESVLRKGSWNGAVEPYFLSGFYAMLTTVSPWYAEELTDPASENTAGLSQAFSSAGMKIYGVTNGIDYDRYNPEDIRISGLSFPFSPEKGDFEGKESIQREMVTMYQKATDRSLDTPHIPPDIKPHGYITHGSVFFSFHGRLAFQKGIDILIQAVPAVLEAEPAARFVITGQGSADLEQALIACTEKYPGKVLYLQGYEKATARQTVAASDFLILPSHFEPCGLEDLIGAMYGTIPVAHETGGLRKIEHGKTGFLYKKNESSLLADLLIKLAHQYQENQQVFQKIRIEAAQTAYNKFNWNTVIENGYIPLISELLK